MGWSGSMWLSWVESVWFDTTYFGLVWFISFRSYELKDEFFLFIFVLGVILLVRQAMFMILHGVEFRVIILFQI